MLKMTTTIKLAEKESPLPPSFSTSSFITIIMIVISIIAIVIIVITFVVVIVVDDDVVVVFKREIATLPHKAEINDKCGSLRVMTMHSTSPRRMFTAVFSTGLL